ncbi:hypothetical protein EPIB2_410 [Tritonibacter mobilis]|nr:hypothetical protein EPIB2_410 [Tritonibacter mobilis]
MTPQEEPAGQALQRRPLHEQPNLVLARYPRPLAVSPQEQAERTRLERERTILIWARFRLQCCVIS